MQDTFVRLTGRNAPKISRYKSYDYSNQNISATALRVGAIIVQNSNNLILLCRPVKIPGRIVTADILSLVAPD